MSYINQTSKEEGKSSTHARAESTSIIANHNIATKKTQATE
jgi:hypothetical protein